MGDYIRWDYADFTPDPEMMDSARKVVCGFADDADDARLLLSVLGLLPIEKAVKRAS